MSVVSVWSKATHWREMIGDRNVVQSQIMIINQLPLQLEFDFEAAANQKSDNGLETYKFDSNKFSETIIFWNTAH